MRKIIILTILFSLCIVSNLLSATIYSSSCSISDVQEAIFNASDGDTVFVPAGSATWTSMVTLDKEIAIIGAGIGNTNITNNFFNVSDGTDNWRISGFTVTDSSVTYPFFIGRSNSTDGCRNFRVDHIRFVGYSASVTVNGHSTGVFDNCEFIGHDGEGFYVFGDQTAAFERETGLGTSDFIFIEDCLFDTNGVSNGHFLLVSHGGRIVVRNNTFKESGGARSNDWIDSHGYCHGVNERGGRAWEIYENTFIRDYNGCCRALFLRAGTGVIYNNTFDQSGGEHWWRGYYCPIFFVDYRASNWVGPSSTCSSNCSTSQYCSPELGGEGYPCCDQIGTGQNKSSEPVYVWGNVDHNGSAVEPFVEPDSEWAIVEGRDYFVGVDKTEIGYSPFQYPHPLRNEEVIQNTPSNPLNFTITK